MRAFLFVILLLALAAPGRAAEPIVKDGNTLQLGGTTFRLDGTDAPEFDQLCVDDRADPRPCGQQAREQLVKLIGGREIACKDLGPDKVYTTRRLGICTIAGEADSLNQIMVREGWALAAESDGKPRFAAEEATARAERRGLWRGCFVAPRQFRRWDRTAALLGASCRADKKPELLAILFPDDPAMPPGCAIKAKFAARARFIGKVGIYHLQGCRSYATLGKPNRWFCSEQDAQAEGFRKAFNCGRNAKTP
ncbi:thermonuclease family protein [Rhodopseudomonas palustris]|uniref:Nuclease (SNase-like) n=1 Tax=Rhodopseudomonas palustris (strain BisB18) TaxID=316056 RepID=Q21C87_RHOPB